MIETVELLVGVERPHPEALELSVPGHDFGVQFVELDEVGPFQLKLLEQTSSLDLPCLQIPIFALVAKKLLQG